MWTFLLHQVLKRAITIPVVWGAIYPTLTGNVVAKNVVLVAPSANAATNADDEDETGTPVATVEYLKVSPDWSTTRQDVITLTYGTMSGVTVLVDLSDPTGLLRCFQNRDCLTPELSQKRRARLAGRKKKATQQSAAENDGEDSVSRKPLVMNVLSFDIEDGQIIVKRETNVYLIKLVSATGGPLRLPLEGTSFELRADLLAREPVDAASAPAGAGAAQSDAPWHPLKALLRWDGGTEKVHLVLSLKDFPLAYFEKLFPELHPKGAAFGGKLSGELALEFDPKRPPGKAWRLV